MGNPTRQAEKVGNVGIHDFRIPDIWILAIFLLAGCGAIQIDAQILEPSFATATIIQQTQQAEPTSVLSEVKIQTPTATSENVPTLSTITKTPTLKNSDFASWDSLINYDLLKDVDWTVFTANVYIPPSGLRGYALALPTIREINPENVGNEWTITNYDPKESNSVKRERVVFTFQCILDQVLTSFEGKEQKIRVAGEPGVLWSNIEEPDRHHEYRLLFEHDGANYTVFGSIDLPSADRTAMEKYQAMIFYAMSSLIID